MLRLCQTKMMLYHPTPIDHDEHSYTIFHFIMKRNVRYNRQKLTGNNLGNNQASD